MQEQKNRSVDLNKKEKKNNQGVTIIRERREPQGVHRKTLIKRHIDKTLPYLKR